jgi:hypothetical protein
MVRRGAAEGRAPTAGTCRGLGGWLGIATGTIGIASEILRPVLGWAYAGYGLLLFVWLAWVAVACGGLGGEGVGQPVRR